MTGLRHVSKTGGRLFFLELLLALLVACSGGRNTPALTTGVCSSFHPWVKTSDEIVQIQFTVTPNHLHAEVNNERWPEM
jgi:hypothetical protein